MIAILAFVIAAGVTDPEAHRIRAHLSQVETDLRAADIDQLPPAARAARAELLDVLHDYWRRGVFPHNHDFPGARRPYFIDRHGTRCAVAHLIEASGQGALVERVAATRNNATVAELAGDLELVAWLEEHGLTAEEAGRIQPTYLRDPGKACEDDAQCSTELCRPSLDDPGVSYCTLTCALGDPEACPVVNDVAMTCVSSAGESLCAFPAPSPGAAGWPCVDPSECVHDMCLAPDEGGICTHQCGTATDCPSAFICAATADFDQACVPAESVGNDSGCSASPASAGSRVWSGLLILLAGVGYLVCVVANRSARRKTSPRSS